VCQAAHPDTRFHQPGVLNRCLGAAAWLRISSKQANYNVVHKHTWSANKTAFLLPKSQTIYDFFYDVIRRTEKNKKKSCGREGKETKVTISAASFQLAHVILMMQKSVSAMI